MREQQGKKYSPGGSESERGKEEVKEDGRGGLKIVRIKVAWGKERSRGHRKGRKKT